MPPPRFPLRLRSGRLHRLLPSAPAGGWRRGARTAEVGQSHLGSVLFGIVEILPVVPETSLECFSIDSHPAGPRGAASSSVGYNLEYWRSNLDFPASLIQPVLPRCAALIRHCSFVGPKASFGFGMISK